MNYYLKAIYWNRLVLIIYSCMMMKSCLFVSSDRSVTPYKKNSRLVNIIEILIASFPGASYKIYYNIPSSV